MSSILTNESRSEMEVAIERYLNDQEENDNEFPVDFDDLWRWAGYSQKGVAKRMMETSVLSNGVDFVSALQNKALQPKQHGGHNKQIIHLTLKAAKQFLMNVNNERGKAVRAYFIEVEQEFLAKADKQTRKRKRSEFVACLTVPIQTTINEHDVADALSESLGGEREVAVQFGRIDILTNDEVIEVKEFSMWKHALGQVLAYGNEMFSKRKRIHLFSSENVDKCELDVIRTFCASLNVAVTYNKIEI